MNPVLVSSLDSLSQLLQSQAQQLQSTLPGVSMTFFNVATMMNSAIATTTQLEQNMLLEGKGPAAKAIQAQIRYLNINEPLGAGIARTIPSFAFEPLYLAGDSERTGKGPTSNLNPLAGSGHWFFPLLMQLSAKGSLNLPAGMQYDPEKRALTVEVESTGLGAWKTTLDLRLPNVAPSGLSMNVSTYNPYEDVSLGLQNGVVGEDWFRQRVVRPLFEINDLTEEHLIDPGYTIGKARTWLYEIGEGMRFSELHTRMPYQKRYSFDNIDLYRTLCLKNPWPVQGADQTIYDVSVKLNMDQLYFRDEVTNQPFNPDVNFATDDAVVGLFNSTPFHQRRCGFKDLPYCYQRQLMDQLPHRFEQELGSMVEELKKKEPQIFESREEAE